MIFVMEVGSHSGFNGFCLFPLAALLKGHSGILLQFF